MGGELLALLLEPLLRGRRSAPPIDVGPPAAADEARVTPPEAPAIPSEAPAPARAPVAKPEPIAARLPCGRWNSCGERSLK